MSASVRRIAVFGPESTGKTTLAEKLAAHFNAPLVAEYAREFWDARGGIKAEDIPAIAREQWRREDAAVCHLLYDKRPERARLVICDTEALTTVLWSDLLYGTTPEELRRGAEARCRHYDLYLLCDIDLPFAPDPQRCFPDPADRMRAMALWRGALEQRGLPHVIINGKAAERERRAIAAVAAVLP
ncbi:MAG: ATP-binding protein [Opitutaceae bacterium]|nr:ATP-binding protein [Opitutaceae bacterium]